MTLNETSKETSTLKPQHIKKLSYILELKHDDSYYFPALRGFVIH